MRYLSAYNFSKSKTTIINNIYKAYVQLFIVDGWNMNIFCLLSGFVRNWRIEDGIDHWKDKIIPLYKAAFTWWPFVNFFVYQWVPPHFRVPVHKEKVELNNRNEGIYNNDFLDSIDQDAPCGTWSMLGDTSGTVSILRSKMWPGFSFYHRVNTNIYGNFYCGTGCKALDLPFMF